MELDYAYDSGDSVKNASLIQRITKVNSTLSGLKRQLSVERKLLDQHKWEMKQNGWSLRENVFQFASESTVEPAESTVSLDKEQLKEIQKRCEEELAKLDDYIFSVNEFKSYWIKLREIEKAKSRISEHVEQKEYMENIFFEKKYLRGKIFYVDSDLY